MTRAIDVLRKEHDAILRMLEVTEHACEMLERGSRLPPQTLSGLPEFFRLFADGCHHGKEEDLLFPMPERKGLPKGGGPVPGWAKENTSGCTPIRTSWPRRSCRPSPNACAPHRPDLPEELVAVREFQANTPDFDQVPVV